MADQYIDPFETKLYGKFAREQMAAVCTGKIPSLDTMVQFAINAQEAADEAMANAIAKAPKPAAAVDPATVLAEAGDVLVRFGSHLDSLKGRPVNPKDFFRGEMPSVLARRRLTKLTAGMGHVLEAAKKNKDKLRDGAYWIGELEEAHLKLEALEKQQRASRVAQVELGPEVAAQRELWLATYGANKHLVRGLLAHIGKPELLPLIFDDLAEVHRVRGVADDAPPAAGTGDGRPAEGAAEASTP
ncbi:MAG: hypothetical protein ACMG6S_04295 [Byssovorax sp.]